MTCAPFNIKLQYMEYDDDYHITMQTIIDTLETELIPDISSDSHAHVNGIYHDIVNGINFAKKTVNQDNLKILTGDEMVYPEHNKYMSEEIYGVIANSMIKQILFEFAFYDRTIKIRIGIMERNPITPEELFISMLRMVSWLFVCNKYSDRDCCNELCIDLYFTDIKKGFPNSASIALDHSHVNSGVSIIYNNSSSNIIIFRYEEWFKVFIHECGHSYGIETHSTYKDTLPQYVKSLISIKINSRIGEAYVETWARIMIAFYGAIENSNDYNKFITLLRFNMKVESIFSAIQAYRILAFMKIPYNVVINPLSQDGASYRESTNIFAYYILCGSFMYDPFKFITWCSNHNSLLMKLGGSRDTVQSFKEYIKESLNNDKFEKLMHNFKHLANRKTGLRFTITELPKN